MADIIITDELIIREVLRNINDSTSLTGNKLKTSVSDEVITTEVDGQEVYVKQWMVKRPDGQIVAVDNYYKQCYTITYIIDNVKVGDEEYNNHVYKVEYLTFGDEIKTPTPEEYPHYTFESFSYVPKTMPKENLVVNINYTQIEYTVEFVDEGIVTETKWVRVGDPIPPYSIIKDGYTARYISTDNIDYETMPAQNIKLYVMWVADGYNLIFYDENGVELTRYRYSYKQVINVYPVAPEKTGFNFTGWLNLPETMPMNDVHCYPQYTIALYTLTYVINGTPVHTQQLHYGDDIPVYVPTLGENQQFTGWIGLPANNRMPAYDLTVSTQVITDGYTITYIIDNVVVKIDNYSYGDVITPYAAEQKTGYSFEWTTSIPSTMPQRNLTVYGEYTLIEYTLTYIIDNQVVKQEKHYYGDVITPYTPEPKEGFMFLWNTAIPSTMPAQNLNIYGQYTEEGYTLTYYIDGQVVRTDIYKYGDVITPYVPEEREGYTFSWINEAPETMPAQNVEVYGQYTAIVPPDYSTMDFTIKSLSDNNTIGFCDNTANNVSYEVYADGSWQQLQTVTLTTNQEIHIRRTSSDAVNIGPLTNIYLLQSISGDVEFYGNITSLYVNTNYSNYKTQPFRLRLIDGGTNKVKSVKNIIIPFEELIENGFESFFYKFSSITEAPELPATTLAEFCYKSMFYRCTSLTSAPVLPATTITGSCYQNMFYGCTSLTSAPVLPATTLANSCYDGMFEECTSLTSAPVLSATILTPNCYDHMFYGCTSLTSAPVLPATTLAYSCYQSMFLGCTSLTSAPVLPATTLDVCCYQAMFYRCTSLTSAPVLPATTLAYSCYDSMFEECTSLTTATIYTKSIGNNWCTYMFKNAKNLTEIILPNCTSFTSQTEFSQGASSTGVCKCLSSLTNIPRGDNGIPTGWTIEYLD